MDLDRANRIIQKVSEKLVEPSLDMELCTNSNTPCINIIYRTEDGESIKTIDIFEELADKTDDDIVNFIIFQIQQFMEKIDSVEYGGE